MWVNFAMMVAVVVAEVARESGREGTEVLGFLKGGGRWVEQDRKRKLIS